MDAVRARIYSCRNYGATNIAPTQKDRPLLLRRGGPTYMSRREQVSWSWVSRRLKPRRIALAKTSRNQNNRLTESSSEQPASEDRSRGTLELRSRCQVAPSEDWKDLLRATVNSKMWVLAKFFYLSVVTNYKDPINPVTSPCPVSCRETREHEYKSQVISVV
jgi:hypothetical protein